MGKRLGLLLVALLTVGLLWYLFLKPGDYIVRFETKALPGTVNQALKTWGNQLDNVKFLGQKSLSDLKFQVTCNDSVYEYHWKIDAENDSVFKVKAYVTDIAHSLANRLSIPFLNTDFEKRTKKTVLDFTAVLKNHLENFKVDVTGKDVIPGKYCACVSLKESQLKKADGMKGYYSLLSGAMAGKNISLDGRPIIEIEDWDMKQDSLSFNFCFPVTKTDSLPEIPNIFYKQIKNRSAIRAVYNGNYITSDRTWYALLDYAEKNDIAVEKKPLEIFHTNPNMGGDALKWKTEVFMPISE